MERVYKIVYFLKGFGKAEKYFFYDGKIQIFDSPCLADDYQETIFDEDGVVINWSPDNGYIDVCGLTKEEFEALRTSEVSSYEG